ncbi:MAG: D-alanyl-D-alanine carboxypeptidase/D-alanyl-D-alanine-endopeptidase [Sedimentisphaerales bacterium]|nr:D-alanyl-D-alanine carboxypeptidase/D-alanyl-D-alanine-endopeptidase [Sedimentisphaerales bacterium]
MHRRNKARRPVLTLWPLAVLVLTPALVARADLASRIDRIIRSCDGADLSVHLISPRGGRTIYGYQATRPLIPASNMKLVTTAAAIRFLGPGFTYKTRVYLCGQDLVIVGSGDPLLGDRQTDRAYGRRPDWIPAEIAERLSKRKIAQVGDIILDSTVFDDQRVHPNWPTDQLNRWYASEVCGINYNCNCVAITVIAQGGQVRVAMDPQNTYLHLINRVQQAVSGPTGVGAYRHPDLPNTLILKGTCRGQEGPFDVAIERPAIFFGVLVAEALVRAGIQVCGRLIEGPVQSDLPMDLVWEHQTPLKDCLARANKDSLGLAAEALFKTTAATLDTASPGSWAGGREALTRYLSSLGLDQGQFRIDDGSGLSRANRLSAACLTRVLYDMYSDPSWSLFEGSLAVAGVDGTLERYFDQALFKGKIIGKTGYLVGVRSLSGVCKTARGDVIFSIIANGPNGNTKKAIADIVKAILEEA